MTNAADKTRIEEKRLKPASGFTMLFSLLGLAALLTLAIVFASLQLHADYVVDVTVAALPLTIVILSGVIFTAAWCILPCGFKVVHPNEAGVYTLFGRYYGTIAAPGFFWVNPFVVSINPTTTSSYLKLTSTTNTTAGAFSKKVSLKATTHNNQKQKINDSEGNPIDVSVIAIWQVVNPTKAVFEVDNYKEYLNIQCDAALRNVARQYPYDVSDGGDEKSLRGSSQEIADELRRELQNRVEFAGLEVIEVRIAHLAYATEIAAAMLQRQQADAIIAARQKIVDGAVGMVEMALNKLSENKIVELDDERKASMVSNLLVVLCGNKDAQPIVNSGSIF